MSVMFPRSSEGWIRAHHDSTELVPRLQQGSSSSKSQNEAGSSFLSVLTHRKENSA